MDYCRCFVLCNKRTHHHRISLVLSLPVDVYACIFVCVVLDGGSVVKTTAETFNFMINIFVSGNGHTLS